jgi:alpha-N-arabinofuranosidase
MSSVLLTVHAGEAIGTIRPELHGHFLEHLGTAVYGGIWVGKDSPIPNYAGLRAAAVDYLRLLKIPVLRWPGGCFADNYHWRDGVGPARERPKRVNLWWGGIVEENTFGTHEFMELCKLLGARPYLAGNVGSGLPAELRDWVEYCNYPFGTTLADERMANGAPGPFGVRYWGIGNEAWGCGGHLNPEEYCALYSRFATFVPSYGGAAPFLVAVGPESNDLGWTRRFFDAFRTTRKHHAPLHGYAMHHYFWGKSKPTEYSRETMDLQLEQCSALERAIVEQRKLLDSYATDPRIGRVQLLLDEWGTWDLSDESTEKRFGKFWQQNTMRDAIAAGLALNIFHRQADKLYMCNLAQLVNVLQSMLLTHEQQCVRTPSYYAFLLALKHRGNMSVRTDLSSSIPLSCSASLGPKEVIITLVNPHPSGAVNIRCDIDGVSVSSAEGRILHHDDWNAWNSLDAPEAITPTNLPVTTSETSLSFHLPPLSVVTAIGHRKNI